MTKKTTNKPKKGAKPGKGKETEASQAKNPKKKGGTAAKGKAQAPPVKKTRVTPQRETSKAKESRKSPAAKKSRKGETHKRGMTDMAWNFCHAYVKIGRKRAAAISVGCSEKSAATTANRWLKNDKVIKKIEQLRKNINKKLELSAESVIYEYMKLGMTNLTDLIDLSSGTPKFKDLEMINPDHLAALQSVAVTPQGAVKFKMHDKKGALDSLAKHLGILKDGVEIGAIIINTDSDDDDL